MSTEQNYTGLAGPPMLAQQQHQTGMPHMQPTYSSAQHTQQQSQQQQNMLNAFAQAPMDAAASQLLMNPQTAAVVATVAAAAAQQMAKHQQQQQHMANQAQAMHPSPGGGPPQGVQQQQQHMAHSIPPPSGTPPVQQVGLPPHLAALLGMSHQQAQAPQNVYAAQQHCAPVAPVVSAASVPSTAMLSNMQTWKHDQLESHVQLLRDTNQTIPQPVAMHLADARRKEEKRSAKRVANRKSACTSRARKKALVEEMTRTNARLKRQALILALLPDLVIAITVEGEITFCSAQVERVLRHSIGDLIGANLMDLLVPASKKAIGTLMGELVAAELAAAAGTPAAAAAVPAAAKENNNENNANDASGQSSSNSSNGVAIVSDQSFPPSVVKVNSQRSSRGADNSELSTSNLSKVTPAAPASSGNSSAPQSANSSLGNDETAGIVAVKADGSTSKNGDKQQSSGDESLSSSSDANNLRQANENLNRNVRWHNAKFMSKSSAAKAESTHKDDVMGQGVTPNNASARLSSLQHRPEMLAEKRKAERAAAAAAEEEENSSNSSDSLLAGVEEKKKTPGKNGNGNSSDESGYRESNESAREGEDDTESSTSDSSSGARRHKPLAPTCNICLIRDDLTTIWCEVTSSIRTRSLKDEADDAIPPALAMLNGVKSSKSSKMGSDDGAPPSEAKGPDEVKELLLCLRPIRDGEQKVNESMRFVPVRQASSAIDDETMSVVDDDVFVKQEEPYSPGQQGAPVRRPVKKRPVQPTDSPASSTKLSTSVSSSQVSSVETAPPAKKARKNSEDDMEKSVVESLMLMGGKC